jgi:hypothetical protein
MRALEGGRAAVNALYAAIVRDPRHRDVTLLDYAEITERRFASWRMGEVNLNRINAGSILRFSGEPAARPVLDERPERARALLEELSSSAAIVSCDSA